MNPVGSTKVPISSCIDRDRKRDCCLHVKKTIRAMDEK
jgi:hypothetical protein